MFRRYKICEINNLDSVYIDANTPKNAIKNMYKDYDIIIQLTNKESATHIIEFIDSNKKVINYYKVIIQSLHRKNKPDNYIAPMPKKQLQKIIKEFKAKGGIILINDDIDEFLSKQGAEGSTLNENTILLVKNPSRSAVYEELIHAEQYRKGKNDGSRESRLLCEIEAQKELIKRKEELDITDKENEQTKLALKVYEEEYKQLNKRR